MESILKIERLLTREPFGAILEKTLSDFLSAYFSTPYSVVWKKLSVALKGGNNSIRGGDLFYCNPYLNIIFSASAGSQVFDFLRDNYLHTPHRKRRFLQKIYVTLAAHKYTARLFATHIMEVKPELSDAKNLVILGGNNRIRLIDFQKKLTWDILKNGFDMAYMKSELSARLREGKWPFPELRRVADDGTWFEAEYIEAVSLNRLPVESNRYSLISKALLFLGEWLKRSITQRSADQYLNKLSAEIRQICEGKLFSSEDRALVSQCLTSAHNILISLIKHEENPMIDLAEGHGDFQDGNILVGKNNEVWIVDWEHSHKRQLAYDYLVFSLRTRFPSGFSDHMSFALKNGDSILEKLPEVHERVKNVLIDDHKRRITLLLFVIEELLWNAYENSNPQFKQQTGAWIEFKHELGPAMQYIADACQTNS